MWNEWYDTFCWRNKILKRRNVFATDGDSAQDGSDFNWDDYLEETGALSVPHHAFKHVGAGSKHTAAIYNKRLCDIHVKAVLSFKCWLNSAQVRKSDSQVQTESACKAWTILDIYHMLLTEAAFPQCRTLEPD